MVLLTSSQVNVAISSGIVILFTTALFLSGYAIQQRTVKHLRAAIRPDNTPQLYLPDRFHDDTTELEDGTIVMLDEYNRPVRMKDGRISIGQGAPLPSGTNKDADADDKQVVLEVTESLPDVLGDEGAPVAGEEQQQQETTPAVEDIASATGADDPASDETQQQQQQLAEEEGQKKQQQEGLVPNPNDETQKPISRAERRRLIKEEIQRLAQGEQAVYYQRRLW